MFFFLTPEFGLFCAVFIIGWLIWAAVKSAGKKINSVKPISDEDWKKVKKHLGPMTWQERIVTAILVVVWMLFIAWLADVI